MEHVEFAYNALGQFAQISRFNVGSAGPTSFFNYDSDNRLTAIGHNQGAATIQTYSWVYDSGSRVAAQQVPDGSASLGYDNSDRLTSGTGGSAAPLSFSYDHEGNRTNLGYNTPTNDNNRLQSDGTYTYKYDGEGNVTSRTKISTGAVDTFTWDNRNRLTSVTSRTSGGVLTSQELYTYDALDQRISQTVDADGNGTIDKTEKYDYVNGQLALVFDGSNTVTERYLYGPVSNTPLAVEMGNFGSVRWFLADNLGTIRDVTDSGGGVLDHIGVDSFGVVTSQSDTRFTPRFILAGMEYDQATGFYHAGERYYNPAIGRFLSQDPLGFSGGDTNLYSYVGNNVPNLIDPLGLSPETPFESLQGELNQSYMQELNEPWVGGGDEFYNSVIRGSSSTSSQSNNWVNRPQWTDAQFSAFVDWFVATYGIPDNTALVFVNDGRYDLDNFEFGGWPASTGGSTVWTRVVGGVQAVGGLVQFVGGAGFAIVASPSVIGSVAGGIFALKGLDNLTAGLNQAINGTPTETLTYKGIHWATGSTTAATIGNIGTDFILPPGAAASGVSAFGRGIRSLSSPFFRITINGTAQSPSLAWSLNTNGARSIKEAEGIARRYGVNIPKDIVFREAKGNIKDPLAYAQYFNYRAYPGQVINWSEFYTRTGKIPVLIREDVLLSDEAIVAVFEHEMHELNSLRDLFAANGNRMSAQRLAGLVNEGIDGNLHSEAWDMADKAVLRMRGMLE